MKILVSACLLGIYCRYNGERKAVPQMEALMERHTLIPVCPEQLGGMPTPRAPSEIRDGRVYAKTGADVTEYYRRGAEETLRIAKMHGCDCAVFKERSPSCGHDRIYDGSFTGVLVDGDGAAAGLLKENGITVLGESELDKLHS